MSYFTKFKSGGAFLTFFILWLFSSSAWAQEVTAEQSVFTAVNSTNLGGDPNVYYETAIGGGTSAPAINNGEIRLYQNSSGTGGGTITISAVEGLELVSVEIGSSMATSIAYTLNGSTDKSKTESLAADGTFLVSDINAQSVTFYCMGTDKSSRLYVNYLKATYKPIVSTQVIKPVLSPEDGTTFTESLTVTASCATEGATIYYTTNGDIPTTGSYVFPANGLTITETTTIKAMAANGELENSEVVTATYEKKVMQGVADELTADDFTATSSSYQDFDNVAKPSGAVYAGNSATSHGAIQLRTTNNNAGIVTTQSGGQRVASVEVEWNSETSSSRVLSIYGSTTAYAAASDLYGTSQGELLGELKKGETTLTIEGDYPYIGLRSKSGAMYLDKVTIVWETPGEATQVSAPKFEPASGTIFTESLNVTASCATEGAIIYYTTNGDTPTTKSEVLTADGVTINETTTIKAMAAMANGSLDPSTVVAATYTKVVPIANLAELKKQELGEYTVRLNNAVVTYAEASKAYIQDETAGLYIYGYNTLKAGTSLNGIVTAELSLYNGLYELMVNGGEFDNVDVTEGVEIPVKTVTLEELAANFAQYESMRVKVEKATVTSAFTSQNGEIEQNGTTMALRAADKNIQVDAQAVVDIVGYPGMYNTTQQLNIVAQEDITELQGGKVTATLSFAQEAYSVNLDESIKIAAETNSTSAIKYTSGNSKIATVDETTGEVTGVSAGSTTITAFVAENEKYTSATASYTITVIDPSTLPEAMAIVAEKEGEYYAMTTNMNSSRNKFIGSVVSVINGKVVDMTGNNNMRWYVNEDEATIQSAVDSRYVVFTDADETNVSLQENKKSWVIVDGKWATNSNGTRSLQFNKSDYDYFGSYMTELPIEFMPIVNGYIREGLVANDYYGTICLPYAVEAEDFAGAEFFSIAGKKVGEDGLPTALVLKEVTELEAGVPYIFSATSEKLVAAYSGEAAETAGSENGLVGSFERMNVATGMYLINDENKVQQCGTGCSISTNRAYINMELVPAYTEAAGANVRMLWFDGVETGIDGVTAEDGDQLVDVYTVGGVKVREQVRAAEATQGLQGGIYIVNGKKVAVK